MSTTADFLVEIGTEELPPKALERLEKAFANGIGKGVAEVNLDKGELRSYATPRRLAVLIKDLQTRQPTQKLEKRGPPTRIAFDSDGKPTMAAQKFADGVGVAVDQLERLSTEKGEWLVFRGEQAGQATADLMPGIVTAALAALPIPKRMRWGDSDEEFVRPVHWVVMLLGADIVPARILGIDSGRQTHGHRFHAPAALQIDSPTDYAAMLQQKGQVIADFSERRARILELVRAEAVKLKGTAVIEPEVLDEVTALVEWPVPVSGRFDDVFLRLPDEVLISTLQDHQRYFAVRGPDDKLLANFIAMSNLDSTDPDKVREGNERVVQPRLADAAFFWDQDRRTSLESRRGALADVVFQQALGSLHDKSMRVAQLARDLAEGLDADPTTAERAANLAKTDLLTEMVGEFPELQGRIGFYYATLDGEPEAVARAIEEQYMPLQAGGALPSSAAGRILAIADRLDSLAGIFATGKRPTGNKDPFALRRAALGTLRILIEHRIDINLIDYLNKSISAQPITIQDPGALRDDLYAFLIDRLRGYLLDGQAPDIGAGEISADVFDAVRNCVPASPLDFYQRVLAVYGFMKLDAAVSLASANKRIANILKAAKLERVESIRPELFNATEESQLHEVLVAQTASHAMHLESRDYEKILTDLAGLRKPVDAFFDNVMVMADDPDLQRNRLALLTQLRQRFLDVADLSYISAS